MITIERLRSLIAIDTNDSLCNNALKCKHCRFFIRSESTEHILGDFIHQGKAGELRSDFGREKEAQAMIDKEPGMGIKFVEIKVTDREMIRNFILNQLMKGIPTK